MDEWHQAGLGLDYSELRFGTTTAEWLRLGDNLRNRVRQRLGESAAGVEVVGSSSVLGLLAKPIVDLAIGLEPDQDVASVIAILQAVGWIYRGDAGRQGGHVLVLETRPWFRVAHAHVVAFQGLEWREYLQFRDLLRRDPGARRQYESVKRRLQLEAPSDRRAYTAGKTDVVTSLLETDSSVIREPVTDRRQSAR